ncbi:carbon-nitrogen hydrolase [Nitratireductor sp. CAU 1489]|uniref:Carbon-nitrogen hydrolase n=1 Tax=Nitratireductor arenosus TaxID=2682096 RepID=A0A844QDY7_9HYPH|nr:carbon-nitrogen hydrolase family protein [Nitratireductor arenosus]MVA96211.1 carbon-nitrogen hydrolase [Nitratireductor arenosus]
MLALHQGLPTAGSKPANITTIERAARAAAAAGAGMITFPELFLTGYNIGRAALHDLAEAVDGPSVSAICEIARTNRIGIVFGMAERTGKQVFNTAVAIDDSGKPAGSYRKIHLFGAEEQRTFDAGGDVRVVAMCGWRVGLAICYDIEFPEMARALVKTGADLICVPTANMLPFTEVPTTLVRARALENGTSIIYANLSGSERDLVYTGMSCIVGPEGHDLARAGACGTALLCCSMPRSDVGEAPPPSTQLADLREDVLHARS